jgi:V/A-type H+-transporting ATPase subunit I
VSTVIFGVLTGSWAADIYKPEYLGQNNILQRFVEKTTILDMMAKPVIALVISLVIGVVNQLYGIVVRIIQDMRQRNWRGALFDGVFWLVYLVGLLLFALSALSGIGGSALKYASLTAVIGGGIGLILTQGRDQGSLAGRFIFGVVSLYGIVGGYGTVSFIGDVLSYSRLLALGLTTAIVGMSFNIIATLIPQIICSLFPFLSPVVKFPVVAGAIIVSVMVFGHLFNFILSILSAFVHSGRLILLEWFGRFYQGGGEWFQPHGFTSDTVEIVRK